MARAIATPERILETAWELLRDGEQPTAHLVQKRLGGSLSTIAPVLRDEFWPVVGRRVSESKLGNLPKPIIRLMHTLVEEIGALAREEADEALKSETAKVQAAATAIAVREQALAEERVRIDAERADLLGKLNAAEERAAAALARAESLQRDYLAEQAAKQSAIDESTRASTELRTLRKQLDQALAAADESEAIAARAAAETAAVREQLREQQARTTRLEQESRGLAERLAESNAELAAFRATLQEVQRAHAVAIEAAMQRVRASADEAERLRQEVLQAQVELANATATLAATRDDARRLTDELKSLRAWKKSFERRRDRGRGRT